MTGADFILWLYGLCMWGSSLNFPAWARLLFRELKPARKQPWHIDVRFMHRIGLTILSFGTAGLSGLRFFDAIYSGHPIAVPSLWAGLFVGCMAFAEPFFLRIDEIHAREQGRRAIGWRLYWIGAVTGTVLLIVLRLLP
jgi:hypothetical protein